MKRTSLALSLLLLMLFAGGVYSAEIYSPEKYAPDACKPEYLAKYPSIRIACITPEWYIEGKIEIGDFKKFETLVKKDLVRKLEALRSFRFPNPLEETSVFLKDYEFMKIAYPKVRITSKGGDVIESMKIGRLIRQLRIDVRLRGSLDKPTSGSCLSACVNILIASLNDPKTGAYMGKAGVMGIVGVHRPSFDKSYFAGLSSTEAESLYKEFELELKDYMKEMGAKQDLIDITFSTPSTELYYPTSENINLSNTWWDERVEAKCSYEKDILNEMRKKEGYKPKNPETKWKICKAMLQSRDSLEAAIDYFK